MAKVCLQTVRGDGHRADLFTFVDPVEQLRQHRAVTILAGGEFNGADAAGGGGGFLSSIDGVGGLLTLALGAFSEGGVSTSPAGFAAIPASAFRHALHFSQGTPNTSGIPAVLHPNEAVIPLSRGRRIPVEMGETAARTIIHAPQTININTPDADSFRRSQTQIAADMTRAGQRAVSQNG